MTRERPDRFVPFHACPVCSAMEQAEFDRLRRLQYAVASEPGARREHAARGGFCPRHTWSYEPLTSPRAIGFAYPPVLEGLAQRMRALADGGSRPALELALALAVWLPDVRDCPACVAQERAEELALRALAAEALPAGEGAGPGHGGAEAEEAAAPPPCCLPHLARLALLEPAGLAGMLRREAEWLEALAAAMRRGQAEDLSAGSPAKAEQARSALLALAGSRRAAGVRNGGFLDPDVV